VNEDPNQILIRQLKEELEMLRKSMMDNMDARPPSRGMNGSGAAGEGDIGASRTPRINTARERELAAIREQLEENQRLLQESEVCYNPLVEFLQRPNARVVLENVERAT
jgi:hypothetical protein